MCTVIWDAVLDPHGGMRGARRSESLYERCMVIWEAVLNPHGGLRGARRSGWCMVILEAVLDPHGGLRVARRSGRRHERSHRHITVMAV